MSKALKVIAASLVIAVAPCTAIAPAQASTPKPGAACSKVGQKVVISSKSYTCIKSGKKLVWSKATKILHSTNPMPSPTPSPSPSASPSPEPTQAPSPTPTSTTTTTTPATKYYVAKDQKTVQSVTAPEACSNPANAHFEIQALVNGDWLPVKLLDSGYKVSKDCSNPDLGARTSLGWAKFYMDPETTYRWIFSGEINMQFRDAQGRGISQNQKIAKSVPLAPIPINLPVAPGPITFSNILDHLPEVAKSAYDNVHQVFNVNAMPANIKSTIWVGPTTQIVGSMPEATRFEEAMKLWAGFYQPVTFGAFFFNTADEPLAEPVFTQWKLDSHINGGPTTDLLKGECQKSNGLPGGTVGGPLGDCTNANGGVIDGIGTGMGIFGVPNDPGSRNDPYRAGALEIHEYTHMVQTAQFLGHGDQPARAMQDMSPCWLQEGMAHFASKTTASTTFEDYLTQRNGEAKNRTNADGLVPPRDTAGVSAYISLQTLPACERTYSWGYATGMLIVEALSAIGGVQSTMALYAEEARGNQFTDAFKLVYGVSWETAQPILTQVVVQDYLQGNMG
jgi:hypothetical protein